MNGTKKGFTLTEMIVVLVILAILAALLIPAMSKWIDKARRSEAIVECRQCVTAAQTLLSESYGTDATPDVDADAATQLAEVPGNVIAIAHNGRNIKHLIYTNDKYTVFYCSDGGCSVCGCDGYYTIIDGNSSSQAMANSTFAGISYQFAHLIGFGGSKIDGVNSTTDGMFAKTIYDNLTAAQRSYLQNVSWSIVKLSDGSYSLYFTSQNYGSSSVSGIKVYNYNLSTGEYRYTLSGRVNTGFVLSSGSNWSEWSPTMD